MANKVPFAYNKNTGIVRWLDLEQERFTKPFFYETIATCLRDKHGTSETGIKELLACKTENFVRPSVFVFHVSRCGSTLLEQMLAQLPKNVVLSEPDIINEILLSSLPDDQKKRALVKSLERLGSNRGNGEENLVVKLDSWHLLYFDLIQQTFPQAKMVFLFREPVAVLASHRRMRGRQMIPGLIGLPIITEDVPIYDLETYALKVLERYYLIMHEKASKADLLLDYSALPAQLPQIMERLGLLFSKLEEERMLARAAFHSKGYLEHSENGVVLREASSSDLLKLEEVYKRLVKLKTTL